MPENTENIETDGYTKFDRISDDVYYLTSNIVLKFNVSLSRIFGSNDKGYTRKHYHNEYEYYSDTSKRNLVSIKRSFDYYLSFESTKRSSSGEKLFIRIGPCDHLALQNALESVRSWFMDDKYKDLFRKSGNKITIMSPFPERYLGNLPKNAFIRFIPTIIDDETGGVLIMFGNTPEFTISIPFDKFMGLYYTISSFNMYQSAITMINYMNNSRPEELNRVVIPCERYEMVSETPEIETTGINGRIVTPLGSKGKISDLEG